MVLGVAPSMRNRLILWGGQESAPNFFVGEVGRVCGAMIVVAEGLLWGILLGGVWIWAKKVWKI